MKTSILDERVDGISIDILNDAWDGVRGLTQQEIEVGLDTLRYTLFGQHRPLIVLIEDDKDAAQLFRMALWEVGIAIEFMHFMDGEQALDFFTGTGCYADRELFPLPQLTVMDLKLTRASGLEILRKIRMRPQLEKLVVVALTGSEDAQDIELARSLQINGWVNKPPRSKDLVEIVRWMLKTWLPVT